MEQSIERLKNEKLSKIAIMGGTFDPVHLGHLLIAESIRESYGFKRVLFIPSGNPPHKNEINVTYAEHRYKMVELAAESNPHFEVSRIEIDRKGKTYTVDTIKELKAVLGDDVDIYFIIGADSVFEILTWKDSKEIFKMCKFIAVMRPGFNELELKHKAEELKDLYGADIIIANTPEVNISSTAIRKKIALGQSIKYMVPESVEKYIQNNGLYKKRSDEYD